MVPFGPGFLTILKSDADESRFDPVSSFAIASGQDTTPADPEIRLRVQDRKEHACEAARLYALAANVTTAIARSRVVARADEYARLAACDESDIGSAAAV